MIKSQNSSCRHEKGYATHARILMISEAQSRFYSWESGRCHGQPLVRTGSGVGVDSRVTVVTVVAATMAQQLIRPSLATSSQRPVSSSADYDASEDTFSPLDDSIYIFPNPSSAPPSPNISELSAPTELTGYTSRDSSVEDVHERGLRKWPIARAPLRTLDGAFDLDTALWRWSEPAADGSLGASDDTVTDRPDRWESIIRRRLHLATSHASSRSPPRPVTRAPSPHPRIHIPLLSFFVSFLSIDDATPHLLSHSSPNSALFPGRSLCPDAPPPESSGRHGVARLLASPEPRQDLREGCRVACDSSLLDASPFTSPSMYQVYGFVRDIVVSGQKALREVRGSA